MSDAARGAEAAASAAASLAPAAVSAEHPGTFAAAVSGSALGEESQSPEPLLGGVDGRMQTRRGTRVGPTGTPWPVSAGQW